MPLVPVFLALAVIAILFGSHLPKLGQRLAGNNRAVARALFFLTAYMRDTSAQALGF